MCSRYGFLGYLTVPMPLFTKGGNNLRLIGRISQAYIENKRKPKLLVA